MDVSLSDQAIVRLDALRAKRIGQMLVTQDAPDLDIPPNNLLLDVATLNGRELLEQYTARYARYGTVPFDLTGEKLRLYGGCVTIWSGYPGAGKTTLLRQLICHELYHGSSVFLATLEEDPRAALVRLAATAAGCAPEHLTSNQMQWFIDVYAERFRIWGVVGIAQHRRLLAVARRLAREKIRHVVIDSLMCLDIRNDDFEAQRCFANLVCATARAENIHIHLVAHPRKPQGADREVDQHEVAGARELVGTVDNVMIVRRAQTELSDSNASYTPMRITSAKQRHFNGWLGDVVGWYHRNFRQFHLDQFPAGAIRYLPDAAYL